MNHIEAMKQALSVLETGEYIGGVTERLRQAIEQAEKQKPYAYIYETNGQFGVHQSLRHEQYNGRYPDKTIPVYTSPPKREWVGLTQEDIDIAFDDTQEGGGFDDFARAIEAKLKEKNT
jgi:hypothetical protein